MFERELAATAAAMVAPGEGMLAIHESAGTIEKRFDSPHRIDVNEHALARYAALQAQATKSWKGQPGNVAAAQKALLHCAKVNSAACFGRYKQEMEREPLTA